MKRNGKIKRITMERNNRARACEGQEERITRPNWEAPKIKRKTEKGSKEGIASPILLCMNFIRRFTTANRKRKGGGLTRRGERWRQTRGMTCLHKKGKEIRNLNYCGMRMALWHQFSWQPENSAACVLAQCANAGRLPMKEEEEEKMKVAETTMFREEE